MIKYFRVCYRKPSSHSCFQISIIRRPQMRHSQESNSTINQRPEKVYMMVIFSACSNALHKNHNICVVMHLSKRKPQIENETDIISAYQDSRQVEDNKKSNRHLEKKGQNDHQLSANFQRSFIPSSRKYIRICSQRSKKILQIVPKKNL